MIDVSDELLAEFAALDPVYVDGAVGLVDLGENFSTLMFRWVPVTSANGVLLYERQPAMVLVRPKSSLRCFSRSDCPIAQMKSAMRKNDQTLVH
jgi:hypothetical protein